MNSQYFEIQQILNRNWFMSFVFFIDRICGKIDST